MQNMICLNFFGSNNNNNNMNHDDDSSDSDEATTASTAGDDGVADDNDSDDVASGGDVSSTEDDAPPATTNHDDGLVQGVGINPTTIAILQSNGVTKDDDIIKAAELLQMFPHLFKDDIRRVVTTTTAGSTTATASSSSSSSSSRITTSATTPAAAASTTSMIHTGIRLLAVDYLKKIPNLSKKDQEHFLSLYFGVGVGGASSPSPAAAAAATNAAAASTTSSTSMVLHTGFHLFSGLNPITLTIMKNSMKITTAYETEICIRVLGKFKKLSTENQNYLLNQDERVLYWANQVANRRMHISVGVKAKDTLYLLNETTIAMMQQLMDITTLKEIESFCRVLGMFKYLSQKEQDHLLNYDKDITYYATIAGAGASRGGDGSGGNNSVVGVYPSQDGTNYREDSPGRSSLYYYAPAIIMPGAPTSSIDNMILRRDSVIGELGPHIEKEIGILRKLNGFCCNKYLEIYALATQVKTAIQNKQHSMAGLLSERGNEQLQALIQKVDLHHLRIGISTIRDTQFQINHLQTGSLRVKLLEYGIAVQSHACRILLSDWEQLLQCIESSQPISKTPGIFIFPDLDFLVASIEPQGDHWPSTVEIAATQLLLHSVFLDCGFPLELSAGVSDSTIASFSAIPSAMSSWLNEKQQAIMATATTTTTTATAATTTGGTANNNNNSKNIIINYYNYSAVLESSHPTGSTSNWVYKRGARHSTMENPSSSMFVEQMLCKDFADAKMEKAMTNYNEHMQQLRDILNWLGNEDFDPETVLDWNGENRRRY